MNQAIELQRQGRELTTLLEASRAINAQLDSAHVLATVLQEALKAMDAEAGTLWTLEASETIIVPQAAEGPVGPAILHIRMQPGEGIVGRVIQTGRGEMVADAQADARWAGRVDTTTGFITRSIICAPLICQNEVIGCLQLINKQSGSLFAPSDLEWLTALGAQAALVVVNSRLLAQTMALAHRLRGAWMGTLDALTSALATRDEDTKSHSYRTVELAILVAQRLGVAECELPSIARGALLHDIGKIGIPDNILLKRGSLTMAEMDIMKQHVRLGYEMLQPIFFFRDAMPIVLYHHEAYDGSGYLQGLKGDAIPLGARIFHVVDVYDALTQQRPYKPAWSHEAALAEIKRFSGLAYDPHVVDAILRLTPDEAHYIHDLTTFSLKTQDFLGSGIA